MSEAVFAICERVAEVQALLDDYVAGCKHTAADVFAKAQSVLPEPELLRAMFDVGYFPPNTPRHERRSLSPQQRTFGCGAIMVAKGPGCVRSGLYRQQF
jgi:hypothetical protein